MRNEVTFQVEGLNLNEVSITGPDENGVFELTVGTETEDATAWLTSDDLARMARWING